MQLNDLFVGTSASVFGRHPNGRFDALVSDSRLAKNKDGTKAMLKLEFSTVEGKAPEFMLFLISEQDAIEAASNPEYKEKLIKSIGINKGILVRLGLADEETVKKWTQSEMVKAFASLKGRKVEIDVSDDKNNSKYQRTNIISILDTPKKASVESSSVFSNPMGQNLDDIPF